MSSFSFADDSWKTTATKMVPEDANVKKIVNEFTMLKAEFVEGITTYIYYTNICDRKLRDALKWVTEIVGPKESLPIDLKWRASGGHGKASLIQIGTAQRVILIRYARKNNHPNGEILKKFLLSRKLIGKKIYCNLRKLEERFEVEFKNIVNFEEVYLRQYGLTPNFIKMYQHYDVKPTAEYNDKRVPMSNWEDKFLTKQQIMHSTFDVVALHLSYEKACELHPNAAEEYKARKRRSRKRHSQMTKKE